MQLKWRQRHGGICWIAVEMIQQTPVDLRPHRFLAVNMSHSMESAVAMGYHLHDVDKRPESTVAQECRRDLHI